MKLLIASDIHGSAYWCEKLLELWKEEKPEKLLLLGDILYHGPRNDLPEGYAPKKVIEMLNPLASKLLCVRGNCEAEVDQMVLPFPVMAEYARLFVDGLHIYATHGHHASPDNLPKLQAGNAFLYGHTHLFEARKNEDGILLVNPGSVSLPKGGNPKTYAMYENGAFTVYDFEGSALASVKV